MTEAEIESLFNEAKLLSIVDHPNILKLHRFHATKKFLFLVTDLAIGGSLKSFIRIKQITREAISDSECSDIIKQILSGLTYIHKLNVVHRDINPKNILVESKESEKLNVVIADFGLGTELYDYEMSSATQRCGTIIYMAPEQLKGDRYNTVF